MAQDGEWIKHVSVRLFPRLEDKDTVRIAFCIEDGLRPPWGADARIVIRFLASFVRSLTTMATQNQRHVVAAAGGIGLGTLAFVFFFVKENQTDDLLVRLARVL
jgi:hypothetical protein